MAIETPAAPAAPAPAAPVVDTAKPAAPASDKPAAPAPDKPAAPATDAAKPTILGGEPAKPGEPAKDVKQGAPEKYTDFKMPEGVTASEKLMEGFKAVAKEHGLSQEGAQKFVDLQAQSVKADNEARLSAFNKQVEDWGAESKAAFGADYQKQFGLAAKAIGRFGTPALRDILNQSGFGNHPELVKMLAKAGAAISEDNPVEGRTAGGKEIPTAKLLYPSMEKKT